MPHIFIFIVLHELFSNPKIRELIWILNKLLLVLSKKEDVHFHHHIIQIIRLYPKLYLIFQVSVCLDKELIKSSFFS